MKTSSAKFRFNTTTLGSGLLILASLAATGCQMDIAGQTLPSGYYLTDDVQYYAPGPEFKLAREAAALKEQSANTISEPQQKVARDLQSGALFPKIFLLRSPVSARLRFLPLVANHCSKVSDKVGGDGTSVADV